MSILQINIWTCEVCRKVYITQQEVMPFEDPSVRYPTEEEWGYIEFDEKLACPNCIKAKEINNEEIASKV